IGASPAPSRGWPRSFSERTFCMSVFKKKIIRYLDSNGRQVPKGTPGATRHEETSSKWYGRDPATGKDVPLAKNKVAAQQLLAALVKKAEMGKAGISDLFEAHHQRPLKEHLADFKASLLAKGDEP